jgi:peptidyl-prolyl cis-trans isomerase A (cyclophilin A)
MNLKKFKVFNALYQLDSRRNKIALLVNLSDKRGLLGFFPNYGFLLLNVCLATLLSACGSGPNTPLPPPNVQASNLFYQVSARFYVGVTELINGVTFSASNCSELIQITSPSPLYLAYSCVVNATGPLAFNAKDSTGAVILSKNYTVPEPQVTLLTDQGSIVLELNPTASPLSVKNFLKYAQDGFYNGTIFHRVIPGFVIQAGGFTAGLNPKPTTYGAIALESQNGLSNLRGTLAMARTSDANSATSQFYLNLQDNLNLDYSDLNNIGYAVFGKVLSGLDVMDTIAKTPTMSFNGYSDVPVSDITITSITRTQ